MYNNNYKKWNLIIIIYIIGNDLTKDTKVIFEAIITQVKNKHLKVLEIGTFTGTSLINILYRFFVEKIK